MPMKAADYHPDWKRISAAIRASCGGRCEWCGKPNGARVSVAPGGTWTMPHLLDEDLWVDEFGRATGHPGSFAVAAVRESRVILTVAHLDQDRRNNSLDNLAALCQFHHLGFDRAVRKESSRDGVPFAEAARRVLAARKKTEEARSCLA